MSSRVSINECDVMVQILDYSTLGGLLVQHYHWGTIGFGTYEAGRNLHKIAVSFCDV